MGQQSLLWSWLAQLADGGGWVGGLWLGGVGVGRGVGGCGEAELAIEKGSVAYSQVCLYS